MTTTGLLCGCSFFSCGMQLLGCSMWSLVPWPGIELWPPALRAWSLSHWTTREVPYLQILTFCLMGIFICTWLSPWDITQVSYYLASKCLYFFLYSGLPMSVPYRAWEGKENDLPRVTQPLSDTCQPGSRVSDLTLRPCTPQAGFHHLSPCRSQPNSKGSRKWETDPSRKKHRVDTRCCIHSTQKRQTFLCTTHVQMHSWGPDIPYRIPAVPKWAIRTPTKLWKKKKYIYIYIYFIGWLSIQLPGPRVNPLNLWTLGPGNEDL